MKNVSVTRRTLLTGTLALSGISVLTALPGWNECFRTARLGLGNRLSRGNSNQSAR